MNTETVHQKRQLYERVYTSLTNVQRSYGNITQQLSKFIGVAIPKTPEDVEILDGAQRNIVVANDSIVRVEDIKFVCGLAIISDSALVTAEEISFVIESLEELLATAGREQKAEDASIVEWASMKEKCFLEVQKVLFELLSYKLKRQVHFNMTELQ